MPPTAPTPTPIGGWCAPGFEPVRDAFVVNFADRGEIGAAVYVLAGGRIVVDLAGGWCDEARTIPWRPDTLVDVYSVGKAIVALLVLRLVDDGVLALDQPIADVWPEFAAGGKAGATVEHALTHRAGVPAIAERLTDDDLFDWDRMTAALAATPAWSPPGERLVYHVNTYGHLLGELVRRATGEMPGERLSRVAAGLGVGDTRADVWFGVPDVLQARCADIVWAPGRPIARATSFDGLTGDALMSALAHLNPPGYSSIDVVNTAAWRSLQLASTSGHASAAGIAQLYAALLDPGRLLSPGLLATATSPRASGDCPNLGDHVTFGLGFQPTTSRRPFGPNPRSFGHYGSGGALGFADPDAGVAFGYAMNHLIPRWRSSRNQALVEAVYASL